MTGLARRSVLRTITAAITAGMFAGCSSPDPTENLRILAHREVDQKPGDGGDPDNINIRGEAKNISGHELEFGQIEGHFYDKAGESIADGWAHRYGIDAGDIWEFSIYPGLDASRVESYSVEVIAAY